MQYVEWLALVPVPFVPEVLLHQADDMHGLWEQVGTPSPPYWAFPWLGGQALAHHVLDHPEVVAGRRVLDLATGSGLVAIAAARCGAQVLAADIDPLTEGAVAANAAANGVDVRWTGADLLDGPVPDVDVVLAGDVLYEQQMARRVLAWLGGFDGPVLLGDPGRDYLPQQGLEVVAEHDIPTTRELEGVTRKRTRVFTLAR